MKIKINQNGFSVIDIILIIVALGAIGAAVYFAVFHKTTATTTKTATNTTSTTTVATNVLKIPELGVQITLPASLSQVSYSQVGDGSGYGLSDAALIKQDPSCTSNLSPLGTVSVSDTKPGDHPGAGGSQLLSNGKYLVIIDPSGVVCADVANDAATEGTDASVILDALKTATLISN